jgi:hypothetical protein
LPDAYEQALRALLHRYLFCDQSVNHAEVVFYGARDCAYRLTGNRLPLSILNKDILQPYTVFLELEKARREAERQARLAQYGRRSGGKICPGHL